VIQERGNNCDFCFYLLAFDLLFTIIEVKGIKKL